MKFLQKRKFSKFLLKGIWMTCRLLTGPIRMLPNYIIIGAPRCGTTSLHNYLLSHPSVFPVKEPTHFFDFHHINNNKIYRMWFPAFTFKFALKLLKNREIITGEDTSTYLMHTEAPKRISEMVPNTKFIVLLRNPVDRAYSTYQRGVLAKYEKLSFEEAIEMEEKRIGKIIDRMKNEKEIGHYTSFRDFVLSIINPDLPEFFFYSYLYGGMYAEQLKIWMSYFPQKQFLILKSEDLFMDPQSVFYKVCKFLNIPTFELKGKKKFNIGDYSEMNPETRKKLVEYFKPHNQNLYKFLGIDFQWDE